MLVLALAPALVRGKFNPRLGILEIPSTRYFGDGIGEWMVREYDRLESDKVVEGGAVQYNSSPRIDYEAGS